MFCMKLKVCEDFYASCFISHIGQADRSQIGVLEGPTFALRGGDGHTQRGTITFPRYDNRGQAALTNGNLLDRTGDGARGARGHELKKLFAHVDLWYTGSVIEPVDNSNLAPVRNAVKRFASPSSSEESRLIT